MNDLYRQELMEIYKNPLHKGSLSNSTVSVTKKNVMCGDTLNLDLLISYDIQKNTSVVSNAKFSGESCAVSIISAELLIEDVIGKSVDEVKKIDKEYLLNLIDINLTTSRVKCAELVLIALQKAIQEYEKR